MKKVFMPSMDELYKMQELNVNIYKYILIKAIESLICNGLNYPSEGILENAPRYLRENPDIVRTICSMYPDEMLFSDCARSDVQLALELMNGGEKREIGLDYLCRFDTNVLENPLVLRNVILLLEKELLKNPKYRFEYVGKELRYFNKGAGMLIDNIFGRNISEQELMFIMGENRKDVVKSLINIEPAYAISLPIDYFKRYPGYTPDGSDLSVILGCGINNYANRYGISMEVGSGYYGKDILTNPDQNVKRLLKCIKDRNK